MKKQKLIGVGIKKRKDGTGPEIVMTKLVDIHVPCKKCGKNNRQHGSKHCVKCSKEHATRKIAIKNDKDRLAKKIKEQKNGNHN